MAEIISKVSDVINCSERRIDNIATSTANTVSRKALRITRITPADLRLIYYYPTYFFEFELNF